MLKRVSKGNLTTLDMEVALIHAFNPRQNVIVPNVSWGIHDKLYHSLHECDLLVLSGSGYATEIEIKISKADLLKDMEKRHGHFHGMIRRFYYAVPDTLKAVAEGVIPERAGLLVVSTKDGYDYSRKGWDSYERHICNYYHLDTARECRANTKALKWTDEQRNQLMRLGTMRIGGLKQKILILKSKIDAKVDRSDTDKGGVGEVE